MKVAVIQFPGSNSDQDCTHALNFLGASARLFWHKDTSLEGVDAVVVPGGFSYGDYLRAGAIARFSPIMKATREFAEAGGLVLGICNGFQILCEAGLLPGALVRNRSLRFRCEPVFLRTENRSTPFTTHIPAATPLRMPIAHGEGCYYADTETLKQLEAGNRILWRYVDEKGNCSEEANPNGSVSHIAGVCNVRGNVAGLMPHPERACEGILGSDDGKYIFQSMMEAVSGRNTAVAS